LIEFIKQFDELSNQWMIGQIPFVGKQLEVGRSARVKALLEKNVFISDIPLFFVRKMQVD